MFKEISRPFDVHKWSNHPEVNNFVNSFPSAPEAPVIPIVFSFLVEFIILLDFDEIPKN